MDDSNFISYFISEQAVRKVHSRHAGLVSGSHNVLSSLDAEASSAWHSALFASFSTARQNLTRNY
jgi:hypothetical protein